jgi:TetR/AcrR family tetracycline transcriptional repressor
MPERRPPLSRERIIETALHLVNAQGLRRLTMRRLGDSLQVEAMAIYHHLPRGKEQLLDALVGHVAELPATSGADLAAGLREWARAYRARLVEHAGVLPLLLTRRNPGALQVTTGSLRGLLAGAGRPDALADAGAHALLSYVIGHCAVEARDRLPQVDPVDWDARFAAGLDLLLASVVAR